MPSTVRALRGATTVDEDTREQVHERVGELLGALFERNGLGPDDLISVIFTATDDISSAFPAEAARAFGLGAVPLLCARELEVVGGTARCIRVLAHVEVGDGDRSLRHVYLEGAKGLRDDLPE